MYPLLKERKITNNLFISSSKQNFVHTKTTIFKEDIFNFNEVEDIIKVKYLEVHIEIVALNYWQNLDFKLDYLTLLILLSEYCWKVVSLIPSLFLLCLRLLILSKK